MAGGPKNWCKQPSENKSHEAILVSEARKGEV